MTHFLKEDTRYMLIFIFLCLNIEETSILLEVFIFKFAPLFTSMIFMFCVDFSSPIFWKDAPIAYWPEFDISICSSDALICIKGVNTNIYDHYKSLAHICQYLEKLWKIEHFGNIALNNFVLCIDEKILQNPPLLYMSTRLNKY